VAAPIWKEFMQYALEGLPVEDFPEDPPGVSQYFSTPDTNVPLVIGMEEEDAVDVIFDAHLRPNVVLVDGMGTEEEVSARVWNLVEERLLPLAL